MSLHQNHQNIALFHCLKLAILPENFPIPGNEKYLGNTASIITNKTDKSFSLRGCAKSDKPHNQINCAAACSAACSTTSS